MSTARRRAQRNSVKYHDHPRQGHPAAPDPWLDRVTRIAQDLLGAEGVLVTQLIDQIQVVTSAAGREWQHMAGVSGPRDQSFCQWVVDHDSPLAIADAQSDPRLAQHPAVVKGGVRAYLGVPLRTSGGAIYGALCAIGGRPRDWTDTDLRKLKDVAALAVGGIEQGVAREDDRSVAHEEQGRQTLVQVGALDNKVATAVHVPSLTSRERQVLTLMARGLGNRAIAAEIGVSIDTVKSHVSHVLHKLQVPSRSAALIAGIEAGLLEPTALR